MKRLMVAQTDWHFTRATASDLPQCGQCAYHKDGYCTNKRSFALSMHTYKTDGCNCHSEYEEPTPKPLA